MTNERTEPTNEDTQKASIMAALSEGNMDAALEVSDWKGFPNYRCSLCPQDTSSINHEAMVKHVEGSHAPRPVAVRNRPVGEMTDRFGNPITVPEVETNTPTPRPTEGIGAE